MMITILRRSVLVLALGFVAMGPIACESMPGGSGDEIAMASNEIMVPATVTQSFGAAKSVFDAMGIDVITASESSDYAVVAGEKEDGLGVQVYAYDEGKQSKLSVTTSPSSPAVEQSVMSALKAALN